MGKGSITNELHFKNLQVGDNDLIGNKFNGHDLHIDLRAKGIDSSHLVWNKESDDNTTFEIAADKPDRQAIRNESNRVKQLYHLDNIYGTDAFDLIYNKLFLDTDVLHLHLIHNLNFDIQLLPIITRLKPTVWTLHDPWSLSGHCIHHYKCDKWQTGCGDCPLLSVPFLMEQDNTALNFEIKKTAIQNSQLDIIVASTWLEKQVKLSPIFKNARIHLVPFGIDHEVFKPLDKTSVREELGISSDAVVLLARCDYSGFKGLEYIEYLLEKLKTNKKVVLILVGDHLKRYSSKIEVKEYGWIKDDALLVKVYSASDIFLMPSTVDTFGMMAVEAMSCKALPIVLEGTALPDTIDAPRHGVVVKRNVEEFLKVVQYYIEHPEEREKKATQCMAFARKKYNKDKYIENILNIYQSAIRRHSVAPHDQYLLKQIRKYQMIEPSVTPGKKRDAEFDIPIEEKSFVFRVKRFLLNFLRKTPYYKKLEQIEVKSHEATKRIAGVELELKKLKDDPTKF